MTQPTDVLPCPLCDAVAFVHGPEDDHRLLGLQIECSGCGLRLYRGFTNDMTPGQVRDNIIAAWNRRTTPSPSSEYRRGVEDAADLADDVAQERSMSDAASETATHLAQRIRALSPTPAQPQEGVVRRLCLMLADCRQALHDHVNSGDVDALAAEAGRAFGLMGEAMDALAAAPKEAK
jgi:hypothetical protein